MIFIVLLYVQLNLYASIISDFIPDATDYILYIYIYFIPALLLFISKIYKQNLSLKCHFGKIFFVCPIVKTTGHFTAFFFLFFQYCLFSQIFIPAYFF